MAQTSFGRARTFYIQILATSDVHGRILPNPTHQNSGSLSQLAQLITEQQSSNPNSLVFDNGDFLQGSPLCDFAAADSNPEARHPVISAMNDIRYDAIGLGNHEFDYGLDFLNRAISQSAAPVVCANLRCPNQTWHRSLLIEKTVADTEGHTDLLRVGVFSLVPKQVVDWNERHLKNKVTVSQIVETAESEAASLRENGADLVICLAHSGLGSWARSSNMENAAIPIARHASIDALICGHTHRTLPDAESGTSRAVDYKAGKIHGVPAVMPGCNASWLGQISLEIQRTEGETKITSSQSKLIAANSALPKQSLLDLIGPEQNQCELALKTRIGSTQTPIHSFFASLPGDTSVALTAMAQRQFVRREFSQHLPNDLPILSAASPYKAGGLDDPTDYVHIPSGHVTRSDLNPLNPFQNTLVALRINGEDLLEWLEMSASIFQRLHPKRPPDNLRDPEFPCYAFDCVFGLSYEIDPSQAARYNVLGQKVSNARRVRNVQFESTPIRAAQEFVLLTNSYRASGGGNFPSASKLERVALPTVDYQEILTDRLAQGLQANQLPCSPWQFSVPQGLKAIVTIGPGVHKLLAEGHRPEVRISELKKNLDGSSEFLVDLDSLQPRPSLAIPNRTAYIRGREVGAGKHLANPVRSGRKQP